MDDVPITIIERDGSKTVAARPIRRSNSLFAIRYRRKRWPVGPNLSVDLRSCRPIPDDAPWHSVTGPELARFLGAAAGRTGGTRPESKAVTPPPDAVAAASPRPSGASPSAPPAERTYPKGDSFDPGQKAVIRSGQQARILVNAGPGTGKTAVICERLRYLVEECAVPASQICLISFTRTAVREIRQRVARLTSRQIANAVQMATLDSLAGQLNQTVGGQNNAGGFDENIRALIGDLGANRGIAEYLRDLHHLFVDEAQDVVGSRAELLLKLFSKLPKECGITVVSDDAQAIYGFAAGDADRADAGDQYSPALPDRIRDHQPSLGFDPVTLETVHRTSDEKLKQIFSTVRTDVLATADGGALARHGRVRARIQELAHGEAPRDTTELARSLSPDSFILFRRRAEAIAASERLWRSDTPHRLRISGLPQTIAPWIAATLGEYAGTRIGRDDFGEHWKKGVKDTSLATVEPDEAFETLRRTASDRTGKLIDLPRLRTLLATRPPLAVTRPELGTGGPIIGTIHACKGREASDVVLVLPDVPGEGDGDQRINEETRILFVGATRACVHLLTGSGSIGFAGNTGQGRVFRFRMINGRKTGGMEVGRAGDLGPAGVADGGLFSPAAVRANQHKWLELADARKTVMAFKHQLNDRWFFTVREAYGKDVLAVLDPAVDSDLGVVVERAGTHFRVGHVKRPGRITGLHVAGMTTYAIAPDDPALNRLAEPWRSSGLILVPVLFGFSWFQVTGG